jgi:hypothetical protein
VEADAVNWGRGGEGDGQKDRGQEGEAPGSRWTLVPMTVPSVIC